MSRAFPRSCSVVVLAACLLGGGGDTVAEPRDPIPPESVAAVDPDPVGEATAVLAWAREALAEEDWETALEAIVGLREVYGDALVPVPDPEAGPAPLHWPARRVVEVLVARLPPEFRLQLDERWRPRVQALVTRAERGSEAALRVLAEEWPLAPEGGQALRLLARRDAEAGRFAVAADRLERWLVARPDAPTQARAGVLLTLLDVRAALLDETALGAAVERFPEVSRIGLSTGRGRTTPRLKARQHRAHIRSRLRRVNAGTPPVHLLPRNPVVLWVRPHDRSGIVRGAARPVQSSRIPAATAWDGDDLYVHDGQGVSRIAPYTGRERWRFPAPDPGAWDFDLQEMYEDHALPVHAISVRDAFVVTVVGATAATGSFKIYGAEYQSNELARENQARLIVLEKETGRFCWSTGTARDTHPVLGDPDLTCASPPLVDGENVYALFARRRGASEIFAACLNLRTGAPRWVTFLARGESGRARETADAFRFVTDRVRAAPWGAPPALSDGELCVLPHAGFAAGLDAATGRRTWIRPLPRYPGRGRGSKIFGGFTGRDAPLAWGGLWILAPFDCPSVVALEARSGRWRWRVLDDAPPAAASPWRHLHGVSMAPDGGPWLRLQSERPELLPLRRPEQRRVSEAGGSPAPLWGAGRGYDAGSHLVRLGVEHDDRGDRRRPVLRAVPWAGSRVITEVLEGRGLPAAATVERYGRLWLLVGDESLVALASRRAAEAWAEEALGPEEEPASGKAVGSERVDALALRARLTRETAAADAALRAAADAGDPAAAAVAVEAAAVCVEQEKRRILDLGASLVALADDEVGAEELLGRTLLDPAVSLDPSRRVGLLEAWVRDGRKTLVELRPGVVVRGDLAAGALLRRLRTEPRAGGTIFERDRAHLARMREVLDAPEGELREAIRLAVDTPAAAEGRRRLKERLVAKEKYAEAADVVADLRLAMVPHGALAGTALRRHAAELQREEARLRARVGDVAAARALLSDLERWGTARGRTPHGRLDPAGPADGSGANESRWRPAPGEGTVLSLDTADDDASEIRSVVVPHLVGPGAARLPDRFLVSRGLRLEIWSRRTGRRVAELPGAGEGWFGGMLQEVPHWLPGAGIKVASLVAREPGDRAGLRPGDWIIEWAGDPIPTSSAFMHTIARSPPDLPVDVRVLRRGQRVLERFVPGRRPRGDGRVVDREELYAAEDGRVLVSGRVDLSWVDLGAATRNTMWSWKEPGVVHAVVVRGGTALVTIRRVRRADAIVAVDLSSARERWRRDVPGTVASVDATGSAVLVTTSWPARVFVLDGHDGSVRARVDTHLRFTRQRARAWTAAPVSASVHGRLWWFARGDPEPLRVLNTTTANVEWEEVAETGRRFEPLIAGDGVVVIARGHDALEVLASEPVTGRVEWRVRFGASEDTRLAVPLDPDTRLHLSGWTLWAVGIEGRVRTTVEVFELVPAALGPEQSSGDVPWKRAVRRRPRARVGPFRAGRPYLLDSRVGPEGLLLSIATTGDRAARSAAWVPRIGRARMWQDPASQQGGVIQIRRHPPARVGSDLLVPIDQGVLVVPLETVE